MTEMNNKKIKPPLRLKKMKCPCCNEFVDVVLLPDLTSRLYWPKKKGKDQHISLWEWKNPAFEHINPYFYSIIYCPKCFFADFREEFIKSDINPSNKAKIIHDQLSKEKEKKESLINIFVEKITIEKMDFEKAIYIHLLAIAIQELLQGPEPQENPRFSRDWKKLARLYLRTAWLFREKDSGMAVKDSQEGHFLKLREKIHLFHKKVDSLKTDMEDIINLMSYQQNHEKQKNIFDKNVYLGYQSSIKESIGVYNKIKKAAIGLKEKNESHFSIVKDKVPMEDEKIYDFKASLKSYNDLWPNIPTSEIDCMNISAQYFQLTADNDRYISNIEGLKMLEFSINILISKGLKEKVHHIYKVFSKRASDLRSGFMKKKSSAKSMVDTENIESSLKSINSIIQDVSFAYKSG